MSCDWDSAELFCEQMGGHLATISSVEENVFVNQLAQSQNIWLGGSDVKSEGVFEWVTGGVITYSNWAPGEPNNGNGNQDYMHMYADGTWDDDNDFTTMRMFVCEWDYCCKSSNGYLKEHTWDAWQILKEPTCFEAGKNVRKCSACGFEEVAMPDKLIHNYTSYEVLRGNKLIPPIEKEKTCIYCGTVERVTDWSYVWVPIVVGIIGLFVLVGIINYIRIFIKGKKN